MNTARRANVLDIVRAVTEVAPDYPEVAVWWYVPRLLENPEVEIVAEVKDGEAHHLAAAAERLTALLGNASVSVRPHRGAQEGRALFRLVSGPGEGSAP
jgi:hypothetical protein